MRWSRKLSWTVAVVAVAGSSAAAQSLRGSHASVDLMYASAHSRDLAFLRTPDDVYRAAFDGDLEMLSFTDDLAIDEASFPFVLPNTHRFADSLARAFHAGCGERLVVTSGVRPLDEQPRNASPKSVHPTGMAVDFRKPRGACLTWLRHGLLTLEQRGVVEATEERHPPHFHVAVLRQVDERRLASSAASATAPPSKVVSAGGDVALSRARPPHAKTPASTNAKSYVVRAGDNLWTIARRHHTSAERLQRLNGLRSSRIMVGQRIKLP